MDNRRLLNWVGLLAFCAIGSAMLPRAAHAQGSIRADQIYIERIKQNSEVSPLSADSFGENLNLKNGGVEFKYTDIDIPGNSALPVRLQRSLVVEDKASAGGSELGGFGVGGTIDLPYLKGVFSPNGWQASGADLNKRCSNASAPPSSNQIPSSDYTIGNWMHIPEHGDQAMLRNPASIVPLPTDGHTYPWITKQFWRFRCSTFTKNGYPGEGFIAISPQGIKYYFDWVVSKPYASFSKRIGNYSASVFTNRKLVYFLVSRIEDRHGNWVNYTYENDFLKRIESNDGRFIQVTSMSGGNVLTVSSSLGNWNYAHSANLMTVTRPDGSQWRYQSAGVLEVAPTPDLPLYTSSAFCPAPDLSTGNFTYTVTQPSNATAVFTFGVKRHYRHNIPKLCNSFLDAAGPSTSYNYLTIPNFSDTLTLQSKTVTGPGLSAMAWSYSYGHGASPLAFEQNCANPNFPQSCSKSIKTTVLGPGGSYKSYHFGAWYNDNDGQLLGVEEGSYTGQSPNVVATVFKETLYEYVTTAELGSQVFPAFVGTDVKGNSDDVSSAGLRPQKRVAITQDGVTFSSQTTAFDVFANPVTVTKASTLGLSKTESTVYSHHYGKWVISQVASTTLVRMPTSPNIVISQTDYYPGNAMPWKLYSFGKLQQTLTYETAVTPTQTGTLASVQDGNNNITVLGNWMRGIPQLIVYPATTDQPIPVTQTAEVNGRGEMLWVKDENDYVTNYGYDAMGRMASITYPTNDTVAWNQTTQTFVQSSTAKYGLPTGHWQQTISTGDARKIVYFDAFWRPVVTETYDALNEGATRSISVTRYGLNGKPAYQSYALDALANYLTPTTGTRTFYDALDRVTTVEQDSELGVLSTTTAYLAPFKTETTNPRGKTTRMAYVAYDQPTYDIPHGILEYEGRGTSIYRDAFGKPTAMRRYWGSVESWRYYVYDQHQRLCKTIEPETGASLTHYDGAGNVDWTATGLNLPDTTQCDDTHASVAARKAVRTYDARNRVKTLTFPDGLGNQTWAYTPDGLISSMTAYNAAGNTLPVITAYNYNKRRLMSGQGEVLTQPNWYDWGIGYGYDANGSLASQTWPTGFSVTYLPNALGQPTRVLGNDSRAYASNVSYHPNGAIKEFTYGNNLFHTMQQNTRQLPARSIDGGSALDHQYGYDANGNVTQILDYAQGTHYNRTMTYDGLDRLSTATSPHFGGDGVHRFGYNALDDLSSWTLNGVKDYATYVYDPTSKRLTGIQNSGGTSLVTLGYDVQGNLASKDGKTYSFDYGNRLRAVYPAAGTVEAYRYDGHGRRVLAWHNVQGNLHSQYSQSGQLMFEADERYAQHREHIYLGGSLIATRETPSGGSAMVKYQHTDALGSPVATTSQGTPATILDRTNYEPYGSAIGKPNYRGVGYTGHVMDGNTGLTYMQQRYYDPGIGRFLSVDQVTAHEKPGENFNRYSYADSNPYTYTDPDGRQKAIAWIVKLTATQMHKIAAVSKEQAVRAHRKGENILTERKQLSGQIRRAAHSNDPAIKHAGHELKDGSKGLPHFQTDGKIGHVFWGKLAVGAASLGFLLNETAEAAEKAPDPFAFGPISEVNAASPLDNFKDAMGIADKKSSIDTTGFQGVFRVEGRLDSIRLAKELEKNR